MKLLDLLDSLRCFHIGLDFDRLQGEIKRGEWLKSVKHLERSYACGLLGALLYANLV